MIFVGKRLEDERTRCDRSAQQESTDHTVQQESTDHTVQEESTDHTIQQESTLLQKLGGTCRNPPPSCRCR